MAKQIMVTVPLDAGKGVTVETHGFAGQACKNATEALEKALGQVTRDEDTDEMFVTEQGQDHQQRQGGA